MIISTQVFLQINDLECTSKDLVHNTQKRDRDCCLFPRCLKIILCLDVLVFARHGIIPALFLWNIAASFWGVSICPAS